MIPCRSLQFLNSLNLPTMLSILSLAIAILSFVTRFTTNSCLLSGSFSLKGADNTYPRSVSTATGFSGSPILFPFLKLPQVVRFYEQIYLKLILSLTNIGNHRSCKCRKSFLTTSPCSLLMLDITGSALSK